MPAAGEAPPVSRASRGSPWRGGGWVSPTNPPHHWHSHNTLCLSPYLTAITLVCRQGELTLVWATHRQHRAQQAAGKAGPCTQTGGAGGGATAAGPPCVTYPSCTSCYVPAAALGCCITHTQVQCPVAATGSQSESTLGARTRRRAQRAAGPFQKHARLCQRNRANSL